MANGNGNHKAANQEGGNGSAKAHSNGTNGRKSNGDHGATAELLHLLNEKIRIVRDGLKQTEKALAARKDLNREFSKQIQQEREEALRYLRFLREPWQGGFLPQVESLRVALHRSVTGRSEKLRAEELRFFDQVTALEEKCRELEMELVELIQRRRALAGY